MARVTPAKSAKPAAKKAAPKAAAPAEQTAPAAPAAEATQAKNTPAIVTGIVDTREFDEPKGSTVKFDADGERQEEGGEIEVENNLDALSEKAAALAFNEEKVTIIISEDSDKNSEKYVFCSVNGKGPGPGGIEWLPRGQEITLARKYVEVLARAYHERVGNEEVINASGERGMQYPKTTSRKYPFQVVEDASPRGRQWLSDLLRRR